MSAAMPSTAVNLSTTMRRFCVAHDNAFAIPAETLTEHGLDPATAALLLDGGRLNVEQLRCLEQGCSYGGTITRMDTETRMAESVMAYTEASTGQQAADMKYRFQWNAPIRLSPHNPDVVYFTSQVVHRSKDQGKTWEIISPGLTTNDKSKQDFSGGEGITRDSTGVEVFCTIVAFEESPKVPGLLWAGSDDGVVHISRDNGKTWTNITPPDMPTTGTVNNIDLSSHDPGRAHISVLIERVGYFSHDVQAALVAGARPGAAAAAAVRK